MSAATISHGLDAEAFEASPEQEAFALLDQVCPDPSVGTEYVLLRLRGALDREALQEAVRGLYAHNETWRTTLSFQAGAWSARPWAAGELPHQGRWPLEFVSMPLQSSSAEQWLNEEVQRRLKLPMRLMGERAIRCTLFGLGPDEHALLIGGHHVALDGYSLFVLLPRLLQDAFQHAQQGLPWAGPPGPSYRDFAAASRLGLLQSRAKNEAYWQDVLRDPPAPLNLPADHLRFGPRSFQGRRVTRRLPVEQGSWLHAQAAAMGVSFADLWLAAVSLLMARYGDTHDLLVAVPNANRRDPELASLFGCVLRTAIVRCRPLEEMTARELVAQVRENKRAAYQHLDPMAEAYASLGASRDAFTRPQVFFNYQPEAMDFRLPGLQVEAERLDPGWTTYDLGFDVADEVGGLLCAVEYDRQLFEASTAASVLDQLISLVTEIAQAPDRTLESLQLVEPVEQAYALSGGPLLPTPHRHIVEHLQAVVDDHGAGPAVIYEAQTLDYQTLWDRAGRVAKALVDRHVGAGDFVAIWVHDPLSAVTAMLGVLRAGAAYLPLSPGSACEHLNMVLRAAEPSIVLVDEGAGLDLGADSTKTLRFTDAVSEAPLEQWPSIEPDQPAYMIYTSGSTGTPKGVVVRHDNLHAQLRARLQSYGALQGRGLTLHSLSFDSAIAFIYGCLGVGGTLVLPSWDQRRDPAAVLHLIQAQQVTHLDTIPCMYVELIERDHDGVMGQLGHVVVGGEALAPALAEAHFARYPAVRLHNEYGPTETTVFSTVAHLHELPEQVTIGAPIPGTWCFIVDSQGRPVPPGVPGELYIGGAGVSAGYYRSPELTERAFVPNPFAQGGPRLYRTGDRVRRLNNGEIEFLGRVDRQIKVRGYRVELGHVEAALGRGPGVTQAAVVAHRPANAAASLVGFVTTKGAWDEAAMREFLTRTLPIYMVPRRIQRLEALPTTPAGKVDYAALAQRADQVELTPEQVVHPSDFPRTQAEDRLACLWQELLQRAQVGRELDFFEAGGDSIVAMRMLGRVQTMFGVEVPLSVFVHARTIEQLAARLHADGLVEEESLVVKFREGSRPPFWMMHAVGGHIVFARRLLPYLPLEQPLCGIQARGLDGRKPPFTSLEEMADHYTDLVLTHQPQGPYFLGGPSYGGLIAWAVAQRLQRRGHEVGLMVLFDAWAPGYPEKLPRRRRIVHALKVQRYRMRQVRAHDLMKVMRSVWEAGRDDEGYRAYNPMDRFGGEPDRARIQAMMESTESVYGIMQSFMDKYQPAAADFPVQLLRAAPPAGWPGVRFVDPMNGWTPMCLRPPGVMYFDSDHHALLEEPMVRKVSRHLNYLLEGAFADREPTRILPPPLP